MNYRIITNTTDTLTTEYIEKMKKIIDISEVSDGTAESSGIEIVLGDTSHPISAAAKFLLAKNMENTPNGTVGYAIYREGEKIAVVWSDFHMEEPACEALAKDIADIVNGYLEVKTFDLMDYLTERGERLKNEAWQALSNAIGEDYGPGIVEAMKELYSLFPDSLVKWLANLYEPNKGGWYWSNSARDYERYLPSLEETYEAVSFLECSGMCEMFGNDWTKATPEFMKKKIADFYLGMQDEDTFFYHEQWPKEFIFENGCQPRITRDIGTAERVLARLGVEPKYKKTAPPQPKKEEKKEEKKKDEKPRMLAQYESAENFKQYLEGLEEDMLAEPTPDRRAYKFYYYGNLFQSTTRYINANPEIRALLIEFLEKYQNAETGMWSEIVCFNATNGLHKIACVANSIGYPMKNIDNMVDTVMRIIASSPEDNPANGGVDIYNAWSCFPYIYYNILHFGEGSEDERIARKEEIKKRVFAAAAETIKTGSRQMLAFKRNDGAYSYGRFGCIAKAQGCPIAVFGLGPESDINGNGIAALALKSHIFQALELLEYEVPLYTERERVIFMNEIDRIVKNGQVAKKKLPFTIVCKNPDSKYLREVISTLDDFVNIEGYIDNSPVEINRQIIIGDFDRGVVNESKRKLAIALEGADEDTVGFAISSEEGRFSIYLSDDRILEAAVEHFKRTFPACDCTRTLSLTEFLDERAEKLKEKKWKKVEEALGNDYGPAIVKEMKALYSLFPDSLVKWVANLYDSEIGGWYWSNSARDYERYLPSLEETYSTMAFLESSGMCEMYDDDWTRAMPESIKKKMADFMYNMQDEDSFFYHKQWPKEFIFRNNLQSRITRDRGSAKTFLRRLGIEPKYQNPAPQKVEKKEEKKDERPKMLAQYESVENFKKYLEGLEADMLAMETPNERAYKFYAYGNLLQSTTNYIKEKPELKPPLIEFLEKYQNAETGMWSEIVCFNATNGLHKIASVANSIGYRMKHIDKMVDTVMDIIASSPESNQASGGVDIYNAWSCLPYIYYNVLHFGEGTEEERIAKKDEIKRRVLASAADTIRVGCRQMLAFRRDDGGYSYGSFGRCTKAQGCPISLHGAGPESDINGNGIAALALKSHIFMALEIADLEVPLYTARELKIFMDIINGIEKNGPVKKKKIPFTVVTPNLDDKRIRGLLEEKIDFGVIEAYTDRFPTEEINRIVIGDVDIPIVERNKARLFAALEGKSEDTAGYAISSGMGKWLIYASNDIALEAAIDHFAKSYPATDCLEIFSLTDYAKNKS